MRRTASIVLVGVAWLGCQATPPPAPTGPITEAARLHALREAEVWRAIDTASLDVRQGPPGSRPAGTALDCNFVLPHSAPGGNTPKFLCRAADGQILKVKYGPDNMEVHGEIFGSRLLWLLGFHSDRIDSVLVRCRGCPEDPWDFLRGVEAADPRPAPPTDVVREYTPAIVERYHGRRIQARPGQGLRWPDILAETSADPEKAKRQRVHREALTLLAAFLGHGDSKPGNQTLACETDGGDPSRCTRAVVYVGDLGAILGRGWRVVTSKIDAEGWAGLDVWRNRETCVARFQTHPQGTLFDTPISEAARAFLAERLMALGDRQVRDLFEVAGLDGIGGEIEDDDGTAHPPTLDDWIAIFEAKRRQIIDHRCAAAG